MPSFSSGYKSEYIALLNEIETKMKQLVADGVLKGKSLVAVDIELLKLVREFEKTIPKDAYDKQSMIKALMYSKNKWIKVFQEESEKGWKRAKAQLEGVLGKVLNTKQEFVAAMFANLRLLNAKQVVDVSDPSSGGGNVVFSGGYPYVENYYNNLKQAMDNLTEDYIKEPPTPGKKKSVLSLRSMVESTIRHEFHNEQMSDMKARGVKLVRISEHSDCSSRCEPYQGKLYSLDGTSGVQDGESYVPIEKATDIFVTTRNGRKWKNGLFGFNCRHRMVEYVAGQKAPYDYTHEEIVKEREISETQREMEREIFKLRQKSYVNATLDKGIASVYRKRATLLMEKYKNYSHSNNRAYYPERCAISRELKRVVQVAQLNP